MPLAADEPSALRRSYPSAMEMCLGTGGIKVKVAGCPRLRTSKLKGTRVLIHKPSCRARGRALHAVPAHPEGNASCIMFARTTIAALLQITVKPAYFSPSLSTLHRVLGCPFTFSAPFVTQPAQAAAGGLPLGVEVGVGERAAPPA